jgi:hypothetical protein
MLEKRNGEILDMYMVSYLFMLNSNNYYRHKTSGSMKEKSQSILFHPAKLQMLL